MVGVFLHEPKAPHTVVSIGVPGTTQSARSEFSAPVKETDSKGETVYTVEADIRFSSAGPDCKMDIYCYEKDFANYPAYLLIFQKN